MDARAARFPLVDSLRAIAALLIVGYHAAFFAGTLADGSLASRAAANLQVGVPVFFLISGFLLYRPFTRARLRGEPLPRPGAYAWRRFLRIVPAYWVALTLAIVLGVAVGASGWKLLTYYGFAQIYGATTYGGGLQQAWTLCVEVTFYALLPLWALLMRRLPARGRRSWLRQELVVLAALLVLSQAYKVGVALSVDLNSFAAQPLLMALPNFLDQFALGMGLAVASVWAEEREGGRRQSPLLGARGWLPWAAAAAAFVLAVLVATPERLGEGLTRTEFLLRHDLWTACALGVVLPAMLGDPKLGPGRVLARRWLYFLGLISYGIFLQHVTVMKLLGKWGLDAPGGIGSWLLWALVGGAGAVALGAASYYAVERPALGLKRLVPARRGDASGEATAEPAPLRPPSATPR